MHLAIIGTGHVGLVQGLAFADLGHDVICQDVDESKIAMLNAGKLPIHEPGLEELFGRTRSRVTFTASLAECVERAEVLFICVGTPPDSRGASNLKYVEKVARQIAGLLEPDGYRLVVDKSTVPVKTAERVAQTLRHYAHPEAQYGVASNPEFLREGNAVKDTLQPDRIVVGTYHDRDREILRKVYEPYTDRGHPYIETDVRSAELIKHVANSFLAMKLSFVNVVARVCQEADADVDGVLQGIGYDARIGTTFMRPGIGYGGSCFPKDVPAFACIAEELGVDASLLWSVHDTNETQPGWFFEKLVERLWILEDKKIAMWGLAFKQDTDDVRQSPGIRLARHLLDAGAYVMATDPQAMEKAKPLLAEPDGSAPEKLVLSDDPLACCDTADALVLGTEWPVYREIAPEEALKRMTLPLVFDGKNSLDPSRWRAAGATYVGVGRP